MHDVPVMTSSRVPGTRPGRPRAECEASVATLDEMQIMACAAARASSRAMYSASSSRLCRARRSHLTRTSSPLSDYRMYLCLAGKVTGIGFLQSGLDLGNLPFVQVYVHPDRLTGKAGAAAIEGLGKLFEPASGTTVDANRHYV